MKIGTALTGPSAGEVRGTDLHGPVCIRNPIDLARKAISTQQMSAKGALTKGVL
ncbi:hypothetical protein H5J25_20320 (plasmid) [Sphingomonas aliaeris]|uniref:Uncharacterized protein n=1 Tax=Sphingomonas aliaeris TaxID=2759526 RepID=A0A974NYU5_9SPHN|nr:hypothetical protein [Sphingomonas aliaeris]QQV79425.1 hypothetical protein H5J25_20320 [Sphingomonas aliaeris]